MPVTAAVVGCGDISAVHLDAIARHDGIDLIGVCDTDSDVAERTGAAHGVPAFTDVEALLRSLRPDVVHVTTPHHQHVDVALAALDFGCHVLTEKPVAQTAEAAEPLLVAARGATTKVGVCLQNRYNDGSVALRRLLDEGGLGAIEGAWATLAWSRTADYYRVKPWRGLWLEAGGGVLINQAIHTIDLLDWFVGPITDVQGMIASRLFAEVSEVEDSADLLLEHEDGQRTALWTTLGSPVDRPVQIGIKGTDGLAVLDDELTLTRPDGIEKLASRPTATTVGRAYWGASHERLIADFYASLEAPQPFWISPDVAMASLTVVDRVYEQSGRRPLVS